MADAAAQMSASKETVFLSVGMLRLPSYLASAAIAAHPLWRCLAQNDTNDAPHRCDRRYATTSGWRRSGVRPGYRRNNECRPAPCSHMLFLISSSYAFPHKLWIPKHGAQTPQQQANPQSQWLASFVSGVERPSGKVTLNLWQRCSALPSFSAQKSFHGVENHG